MPQACGAMMEMNMERLEDRSDDIVDLGNAAYETKGALVGNPSDGAGYRAIGMSDE
ncbi:benenodin family lasso peptide [Sphingobium yanoikuyae]|uniref:Benenodin family lasso peptide n=1 Tax=Sphingobium yanoikuyae TaxID=13690 RepID=A0A3G2USZ9_SPHYA|nr:benenodin family lasso peptide [Sphingobium yanoikuyae]